MMSKNLNNYAIDLNNIQLLNLLTSNILETYYGQNKEVKFIETKVIQVKPQATLPTTFKDFYCAPEKNGTASTIKTLSNHLGIKRENKISFKTDYISTSKETSYNGFQLSMKLDKNDVKLVIKDISNRKKWIVCWNISLIHTFMKKKNPFITESSVRTLLLKGSLKVKFNVSEIKDHGTLWKVFKK